MSDKIVTDSVLKETTKQLAQLLADNCFEPVPYTDEEISNLFSLTPEESQKLTDLIADEVVSKYKIWSSKKINDELISAKSECNDYTDSMLSNISSITIDYVDSLPTTGNSSTIYILKSTDGTSKDTLNLYNNGTWTNIGDFEINLEEYYKKSEIDTKLDLKADKTEILSQDDVITDTSLATTSNVLSATTTIEELDKKVDKDSIATTIDENSTDDEVVGAKTFYDDVSNKNMKAYTTLEQVGLTEDVSSMDEILTAIPFGTYFNISTGLFINRTTLFPGKFQSVGFLKIERTSTGRPLILYSEKETDVLYKGYLNGDGTFKAWGRLCTTSVEDVTSTVITTTNPNLTVHEYIRYRVKNGMCFVSLGNVLSSVAGGLQLVAENLPTPEGAVLYGGALTGSGDGIYHGYAYVDNGVGKLFLDVKDPNTSLHGQFSYPVAES